jgi:hypothetical protein
MRVSPPVEVGLRHHDRWRDFVLTIVLSTGAAVTAWLVTAEVAPFVMAVVAVSALAASVAAVSIAFPADRILRWTGQRWQLIAVASDRTEAQDGEVRVALDLGSWMLLRFTATGSARPAVTWLPVQRRGLESGWHGLRCALYAPHPPSATP